MIFISSCFLPEFDHITGSGILQKIYWCCFMKKILRVILGLLALLIIGAVILASFADINSFKPQIIAQISSALRRQVTMDGDISLRILPTIAIKTGKVTISNPDWAGGGNMLSADSIALGAELMPLLSRQVHINSLEIQNPVLLLAKKGSQSNWQFGEQPAQSAAAQGSASGRSPKLSLSVKHVYIGGGDLIYRDLDARSIQHLQDFTLQLTAPDMEEKISVEITAKLNGKDLKLKSIVGSPLKMLNAERSNLEANITWENFSGVFKGEVQLGKIPNIKGTLRAGSIDVNEMSKNTKSGDGAPAKAAEIWSDAPLDFSPLNALNADLDVTIDSLTVKNMTIKPLNTKVNLSGGELKFKIPQASAYGGTVSASVQASAQGALAVSASLAGVQAEPFLTDWANNDNITGTLSAAFNLHASGKSQRAMIGSLEGTGNFTFKDGAIKGRNLAANIRKLKSLGAAVDAGPQQTDFSELSGSANVNQGIVHNSDLFMKSPLIRLRGEGEINLPAYQISYRLTPEIVSTLKGQGGKDEAAGLSIPLKISGNLNNPTYAIDAKAALMENLTPEKIDAVKDNVKALKEQYKAGGGLKGLKNLLNH